jgi:rare lipoprotein A
MLAGLALAGCAKKHPTARTPAPPLVRSGETGLASWYGHPYHGRPAANGEIYDMEALTAAHRTLPFGTWVRVVNLSNDKTIDVRITDRGPFVENRIIDLSHAAAVAIDLIGPGVARVRLDILSVPTVAPRENWYGVQAGAFLDPERAERLRASLERAFGPAHLVQPLWYVSIHPSLIHPSLIHPGEPGAPAVAFRMPKVNRSTKALPPNEVTHTPQMIP